MTENTVGLIIFFAIAMGSALVWHWFVPGYLPAVVGASVTTVVVFQAVAYLELGYLDPFFLVALATSSVMATVVALFIGVPVRA